VKCWNCGADLGKNAGATWTGLTSGDAYIHDDWGEDGVVELLEPTGIPMVTSLTCNACGSLVTAPEAMELEWSV
jgi:hypothetical protein